MINKEFGEFKCLSCGNPTPVKFKIGDIELPLCRECSDSFAEQKIERYKKRSEERQHEIINLKKKIKQMNTKSANHKKQITELLSERDILIKILNGEKV